MRARLRKVGNSRGILIPAAMVKACNLGDDVELQQKGRSLIIRSANNPRDGWFASYKAQPDDDAWGELPVDDGTAEWTW